MEVSKLLIISLISIPIIIFVLFLVTGTEEGAIEDVRATKSSVNDGMGLANRARRAFQ